jgi:hypothetical protein
MCASIQYFEMEMQVKMNTILGMRSKTNNVAPTFVKPTKNVYKVILYTEPPKKRRNFRINLNF